MNGFAKKAVLPLVLFAFLATALWAQETTRRDRAVERKRQLRNERQRQKPGETRVPPETKGKAARTQRGARGYLAQRAFESSRFAKRPGGMSAVPFGPALMARNISLFDTDGDGTLSRQEYEAGASQIFELLDANGDGKLERTEMDRNLEQVLIAPEARARQLMFLFDENRDQKITPEECLVPPKAFAELDADKSGALEEEDLLKLTLTRASLLQDTAHRAATLLAELDENKDGKLSEAEFTIGKAAFQAADRDGDGILGTEEMKTLPPLPPDHPRRRAEQWIASLDRDGDRMLSQNEFRVPGGDFDTIDENQDGLVDLKELVAWLSSERGAGTGRRAPPMNAQQFMRFFDRNGDGKIAKDERGNMPEQVWQRMDLNADGVVEAQEIMKARALGAGRRAGGPGGPRFNLYRGNPPDLIKNHDQDKDGKLSLEETGLDKRVFDRMDSDGDGKLTGEEISAAQEMTRTRMKKARETRKKQGMRINP